MDGEMKWDGVKKKVRRKAESEVTWVLLWSWLDAA